MVGSLQLGWGLGAVNSSESLIILQWEYNWIDEADSDCLWLLGLLEIIWQG